MMLKIWTKVPDFLSKSVLKNVQVQNLQRDWDQDGGMHWRKFQKGRNCWPICTIFNDTHKTRGKSFVHDMITLTHPWWLLKTYYTFTLSIHTLSRCLRVHCDPITRLLLFLPDTIDQQASAICFPTKGQMFRHIRQDHRGFKNGVMNGQRASSTSGELGTIESNAEEVWRMQMPLDGHSLLLPESRANNPRVTRNTRYRGTDCRRSGNWV